MPTAEVARRTLFFVAAATLLTAALLYISAGSSTVPDTLPSALTDKEFWTMITDFSEAGGYFRSDNFLSNESGYQYVIPLLKKTMDPGGVYLGVGPEQNFTYIVGLQPKIAFVVDIRRQNMLEHLLYKALMELSGNRAEFLSRLFSRPQQKFLNENSTPEELVRAFEGAEPAADLFETNVKTVLEYLEMTKGFGLSAEDEDRLRYVYRAFFDSGPALHYTFVGGYGGFMGMPTYGDLMMENDGRTHNWNFLASEEQYRSVQRFQKKNLIVPLVGDFAGPKAIRSVGEYLRDHKAVLTVFYTSNVEQYLFQDEDNWGRFYMNVDTVPVDSSSAFIRYVLNSRVFSRRTMTSSIPDVVRAYKGGKIRSYYDVIEMSR